MLFGILYIAIKFCVQYTTAACLFDRMAGYGKATRNSLCFSLDRRRRRFRARKGEPSETK